MRTVEQILEENRDLVRRLDLANAQSNAQEMKNLMANRRIEVLQREKETALRQVEKSHSDQKALKGSLLEAGEKMQRLSSLNDDRDKTIRSLEKTIRSIQSTADHKIAKRDIKLLWYQDLSLFERILFALGLLEVPENP